MVKLCFLMVSSMVLAYFYEHSRVGPLEKPKRANIFFVALCAILICFCGFRGAYNDTWNYREVYTYLTPPFPEAWDEISYSIGDNPAFHIIQSFFKTFDTDVHLLLMFFAFWTVLFMLLFLRKYSTGFAFTIYLFFTMGCYVQTLAAIKQGTATAICLMAIPFALEKKWVRFFLVIGIAMLFHPYALLYLIVPFMMHQPWSKKTYILIVGMLALGVLLQPLMGTVINVTTALGETYDEELLGGSGINIIRAMVWWFPAILSFLYRKILYRDSTPTENLFANLTIVCAGINFIALFGTAVYFSRLAAYFSMTVVVSLPWMLAKIKKNAPFDGSFFELITVIAYMFVFYYTNVIEDNFSNSYQALNLFEFLEILFNQIAGVFS